MKLFNEIKWFIQRGRRGYSDRDVWDAHSHICRVSSGMIKELRLICNSYPDSIVKDEYEWKEKLYRMEKDIMAYDYYQKTDVFLISDEEESLERTKKGLKEMAEVINHLWD